MTESQKVLHDLLLSIAPEGTEHKCLLCDSDDEEEPVTAKTYSEDEVKAQVADAVSAALADSTAKIDELSARLGEKETSAAVDAAVAEAVASKDAKIAELESDLEAESIARKAAEDVHADLVSRLETEAAKAEADSRKADRLEAVRALAIHPEDFLAKESVQDRWAAMSDEEWVAQLDEYESVAASKPKGNGPLPKERSALTDMADEPKAKTSAYRAVLENTAGVAAASN